MSEAGNRFQLPFRDRLEAGQILAIALKPFAARNDVVVLGLPRGGVIVAAEVARELELPLDVFIVRKLGVPGHEELAMGAIASGGTTVMNYGLTTRLGIAQNVINAVVSKEYEELKRREKLYRAGRQPLELTGKTILLIDDGIATGSSIIAAVRALRKIEAAKIIIATPVVTSEVANALRYEADEVVPAIKPENLDGVGLWYKDFHQISDEEVLEGLDSASNTCGSC